ncbi:MAG: thioredoxin family protein [Prevotella sp.]|nr:thioredoxin family protein [Prevotella sp.]
MKKNIFLLWALVLTLTANAQMMNPVHFTSQLKTGDGAKGEIIFHATIDKGWHVYSTDIGDSGPIEATFNVVKMDGAELVGKLTPKGKVITQMDKVFNMELKFFENEATFVQKVRFTKPDYDIDCYLEYGTCNDESCLPPSEVTFKQQGKSPVDKTEDKSKEDLLSKESRNIGDSTQSVDKEIPKFPDSLDQNNTLDSIQSIAVIKDSTDLWAPVTDELQAFGAGEDLANQSLLWLLLMGFVGGLLAVCMPCIWPIIPMTVSFFLKRSQNDKKKGIREAFTYGLSIIVIYLALGLLVTALFGSDTLNAMSTNAVFNIFIFLLLVVFALSFFGWFEIRLPSSWANKIDQKSDELSSKASADTHHSLFTIHYSLLSIFLMAFTLVLVSFSCTAPIVGMLLVETTTTGNWLAPAIGMFGFALALALPFTLFAMFPSWLKSAPKSGSWMNTLKIVLGFVELAFALKFLSVADLAYGWHILDREVFLSLWIVIFALLGAYLCGWLKFQSDEIGGDLKKPMPVLCIMGGLVSLAFAVYMVPGLWGAPCKAVSAFAPPISTQDFNLNPTVVEAQYKDYESGMAAARVQGKPVFIDFTGFGCVNCRKMEAAVWTDARVADKLINDYVLISLYVDDKTPLQEPMVVTDAQGQQKTLRTVGAKWSYLQSHKFGANAQPFYVAIDPVTGKPLTGSRAFNEDIAAYLDFLNQGLTNYRK